MKHIHQKKGDITIETVIKITISVLILLVILFIIFRNTDAMRTIIDKITGFF